MTTLYRYLPSLEKLKNETEDVGIKSIIKKYCECEFLISSEESLNYLYDQYNKVKGGNENERIQDFSKSTDP